MTYPPKIAMCLKEDTFSKPSFLVSIIYVKFSGVYMFGVYQKELVISSNVKLSKLAIKHFFNLHKDMIRYLYCIIYYRSTPGCCISAPSARLFNLSQWGSFGQAPHLLRNLLIVEVGVKFLDVRVYYMFILWFYRMYGNVDTSIHNLVLRTPHHCNYYSVGP